MATNYKNTNEQVGTKILIQEFIKRFWNFKSYKFRQRPTKHDIWQFLEEYRKNNHRNQDILAIVVFDLWTAEYCYKPPSYFFINNYVNKRFKAKN